MSGQIPLQIFSPHGLPEEAGVEGGLDDVRFIPPEFILLVRRVAAVLGSRPAAIPVIEMNFRILTLTTLRVTCGG